MRISTPTHGAICALAVALVGMGCPQSSSGPTYPPASLKTSSDVQFWASASAPNVFFSSILPLTLAEITGSADGGCPLITTSGTTTTYAGGCSTGNTQWVGSSTETMSGLNAGQVSYNGFGIKTAGTCDGGSVTTSLLVDGTLSLTSSDGGSLFSSQIQIAAEGLDGGCDLINETEIIAYSGSLVDSSTKTWNGSGQVSDSVRGSLSASTKDEVQDSSTCSTESASGTTTLTSGADTAIITYDGATNCDPSSTVTWTLNGTAMGTISGVSCSTIGGAPALGCLMLLALGLELRRRARAQRD